MAGSFIKTLIRIGNGLVANDGTGDDLRSGASAINTSWGNIEAAVNALAASQGSGVKPYATYAALTADAQPDNTVAVVYADPTPTNNTSYVRQAGAWVTAYDRLTFALGNGSGFQQSGGVLRTIAAKLGETVSFFDYIDPAQHDAIRAGTYTADVRAQCQAALDYAVSRRVPCVINGGFFFIGSPGLIVRKEAMLVGMGRGKSIIVLANGANSEAITFDQTVTGNMACTLSNFSVYGNKTNQTDSTKTLVDLKDPVSGSSRILVEDLFIQQSKGGGLRVQDINRDSIIRGITVYQCDGVGVDCSTADSCWNDINSGSSGLEGVIIRRSGTYGTMKSWSSGQVTSGSGHGFHVLAPAVIAPSLWAQDNSQSGLFIDGSASPAAEACSIRIISENNGGMGAFFSNTSYNRVDLLCRDRSGGAYTHSRCIRYFGTSANNEVNVTNRTSAVLIDPAYDLVNNITRSSTRRLVDKTYAFTFSVNPVDAEVFRTTLTGNLSVQAPNSAWYGCEIEFQLIQDGTGGRTVAWNAIFKVNWTPDTTAGKTNTIRFRYDGTNWVQMSAATGL